MHLNIAQKIFGIALVVLALMAAVAVYSIQLTARISDQLDVVVGKHLPISEAATRINVQILEQGIFLQRLFVFSQDIASEKAILLGRQQLIEVGKFRKSVV